MIRCEVVECPNRVLLVRYRHESLKEGSDEAGTPTLKVALAATRPQGAYDVVSLQGAAHEVVDVVFGSPGLLAAYKAEFRRLRPDARFRRGQDPERLVVRFSNPPYGRSPGPDADPGRGH